jgi:hypothetical protein
MAMSHGCVVQVAANDQFFGSVLAPLALLCEAYVTVGADIQKYLHE